MSVGFEDTDVCEVDVMQMRMLCYFNKPENSNVVVV